ncbi:Major facilitator superfamily permease-Cdc91p [Ceraceosorus bombacis]|uniref:Major facilitator superfamily permease-Cdc91p n=1 Tax=Ceraceosorus bombacis TaxID=401625 RepID=A0A0P1BMJ7_9BASI|nr:Major facilitator superfamily permease-Cdc91p [Ceraceosorus bombacis]
MSSSSATLTRLIVVLISATALRVLLSPLFKSLELARRPELSVPISSLFALREASWLHSRWKAAGSSSHAHPYAGDNPVSPLLVYVLKSFLGDEHKEIWLWATVDLVAGLVLASCAAVRSRNSVKGMSQGSPTLGPDVAAALYLFSPHTIASCLAKSASQLNNLLVLLSTLGALTGSRLLTTTALAGATLSSLTPILLAPPLLMLCAQRSPSARPILHASLTSLALLATLSGGLYASYHLSGSSWRFLERVYSPVILLPDLTPNIGLWWYFFIEIFDHFRNFFLLVFNVHLASYTAPMTIKYSSDPLFAVTALSGVISAFKSYPTMGDTSLFLALVALHVDLLPYLRYPIVSVLLYLYATLLLPTFHHLWLQAGSGNANFYYAITLVWGLAQGSLLLDLMWAWGRAAWERQRLRIPPAQALADEKIAILRAKGSLVPQELVRDVIQI